MREPIARLAWACGRLMRLVSGAGHRTSGRVNAALDRWSDAYWRGRNDTTE